MIGGGGGNFVTNGESQVVIDRTRVFSTKLQLFHNSIMFGMSKSALYRYLCNKIFLSVYP